MSVNNKVLVENHTRKQSTDQVNPMRLPYAFVFLSHVLQAPSAIIAVVIRTHAENSTTNRRKVDRASLGIVGNPWNLSYITALWYQGVNGGHQLGPH